MRKSIIAVVFVIIQGSCLIELMAASIAVTPELDKKRESLPFIFSTMIEYGNPINTVEDFEYMRKYYGVNEGFTYGFASPELYKKDRTREKLEASDAFQWYSEMKKHGFFTTVYQGGGTTPLRDDLLLPGAVDEHGNKDYYNPSHYASNWRADQISELFFTNRAKPKIDLYSDMGVDILRMGEYGFYFLAYSDTDIEQFRKDLLEEDQGIDWQFHDGQVKKLHFWEYAKAQLGIRKEDFKPASLGNFTSYREYVPAKIRGGGDHGDFLQHSNNWFPAKAYDSGEIYWRNVNLYRYLYEYEYFKHCQSWFKYSKQKGFKYIAWGPNGGFYRDTPHDPYVDYMDIRFGQGRALMLPGQQGGAGSSDPGSEYTDIGANRTWRYLRTTSTMLGKPGLGAYEPAPRGRLSIASYRTGFGQVLVFSTLAKPRFIYPEFPVLESIFDTGSSYSLRQSGICGYDAYRQLIVSKLYNGSILKSNWLVLGSVLQYKPFGYYAIPPRANFGDMRTELLLNEGYIPDTDPSNGTDGISLDDYKVITMGGIYYNPIVIDRLKEWLEKDKDRTLFTNYLFLGQYLWGHNGIDGKRYTNLGIWNSSDIVERKIEYVTWTDKNILPNVKLGKYSLRVAVPSVDIMGNLPSEAKVVMKGRTVDGIEVPLVVILSKGQNRIINITFAMEEYTFSNVDEYLGVKRNSNLEFARDTMQDLFAYVQEKGNFFITRVKCDYPYKMVFREIARDNKGVVTICGLASPGQRMGLTLVDPLILEYENHKVITKIDRYAPIIASLDGSVLVSGSAITIDDTQYVKKVVPETIYVLAALDDKSYHDSKLFHLWTYEPTTISFLRPKTWEHKSRIKIYAFNPNATDAVEIPFKLKDEYIEIKTEGAIEAKLGLEAKGGIDYKICYGEMEESLWKEFSNRLGSKEQVPKTRFDDANWDKGTLTNMPITRQNSSGGWYRLHIKVPKEWQDNSLVLDLGIEYHGIQMITYFNGKHQHTENIERWGNTNIPRRYIISKKIVRYGEDNVIAVNVYSWSNRQHPIGDGYVRLINPTKGETLNLFNLEWLSKKGAGERNGIASWARY